MSILDLSEVRLSTVQACLSGVRACLSGFQACLSEVWACLSGVRACISGVWARLSRVQACLSRVRARLSSVWGCLSGVRARLSGVRKNIKTLITLLFSSFERREKNLCHNHIFRIRFCKKRFKMNTHFKIATRPWTHTLAKLMLPYLPCSQRILYYLFVEEKNERRWCEDWTGQHLCEQL